MWVFLSGKGVFAKLWTDIDYTLPWTSIMSVYKVQMEGGGVSSSPVVG